MSTYILKEPAVCLHANSKNSQCVHWISNIIIQYWDLIYCVLNKFSCNRLHQFQLGMG